MIFGTENLENPIQRLRPIDEKDQFISAACSQDNKYIGTIIEEHASKNRHACIYDTSKLRMPLKPDPRYTCTIPDKKDPVTFDTYSTATINPSNFSSDGRVATIINGTVWIWDIKTGARKTVVCSKRRTFIRRVAFTPDNKHLLIGSLLGAIDVHRADNGELINTLQGDEQEERLEPINQIGFDSNGEYMVTVTGDHENNVHIWRTKTILKSGAKPMQKIGNAYGQVIFSPDGHQLAINELGGKIAIWSLGEAKEFKESKESN